MQSILLIITTIVFVSPTNTNTFTFIITEKEALGITGDAQ
jgi:hypothetical protein